MDNARLRPYRRGVKPLAHPSVEDITLDGVFHALADPVRRQIFAAIAVADTPQMCLAYATIGDRTLPKSTLSVHFNTLRSAGLIRSERHGTELLNVARTAELRERFGPLIDA